MMRPPALGLSALLRDRRGMSALEFALVAPIFGVILAAAVDLGGALLTKYRLDAAVAAGATYALVNGSSVGQSTASDLARDVATVVRTSQGASFATVTVVVNNGSTATTGAGSAGTAAANSCYCPTGSPSSLSWGAATTCNASCGANAGYAGKFVRIVASRAYDTLFPSFGLIDSPMVSGAVVQVAAQ